MPSVRGNIAANYAATAWATFAQIAFIPVYIRYLGLEAYGLVGLHSAAMVWLSVADLGITPTLTRETARYTAGERSAAWLAGLLRAIERLLWPLGALIVVAGFAMAGWLTDHWLHAARLDHHQVELSLDLIALTVVSKWLGNIYRGGILGLQDQVWLAAVGSVAVTLRSVGVLPVLRFISSDVRCFFVFGLAVTLLETGFMRHHLRARIGRPQGAARTSFEELREAMHFSAGMLLINVISVALTQLDKILLTRLLPLAEFGAYSFAVTVASVLMSVSAPVFNALYPRLAQQVVTRDVAGQYRTYLLGSELVTVLVTTAAATLITFQGPIIALWTGSPDLGTSIAPYFSILVFANMLFAICHIPYALQLAHGWIALSVRLNLLALAFVVPALLVWVPRNGCIAAATIWLGVNLAFFLVQVGLVNQRAGLMSMWHWLLRVFAPPALVCLAYFALVHALDQAWPGHRAPIVVVLLTPFVALGGLGLALLATSNGRRLAGAWRNRQPAPR